MEVCSREGDSGRDAMDVKGKGVGRGYRIALPIRLRGRETFSGVRGRAPAEKSLVQDDLQIYGKRKIQSVY